MGAREASPRAEARARVERALGGAPPEERLGEVPGALARLPRHPGVYLLEPAFS